MAWPRISVVTVSYNHAQFLEQTLQSVLGQNYTNLEYILIDGGSTDGSVDIIKRYSNELAYWVSEPDEGQTHGLVKGFERATGEIQCWLCSDDLHEPWTLREVARFFVEHPAAQVVYGDSSWIDISGHPIKPKREHSFNRFIWTYDYNYIPQPSTFWRKELYDLVGGIDLDFKVAMDADLWIRFADVTNLHHVRRYWSRMRFYPEQRNQRLRALSNAEDMIMWRRYTKDTRILSRTIKKRLAKSMRIMWKMATGCYWWGRDNPFAG